MILTSKLIGRLNRVFNRTPVPAFAMTVTCDGTALAWSLVDYELTLTPTGGTAQPITIGLAAANMQSLAGYIGQQAGYSILVQPPAAVERISAYALLDGSGASVNGGGVALYAYTNPAWAWLDSAAWELKLAATAVAALPGEMAVPTADGEWLDYQGFVYGDVSRYPDEPDAPYQQRIIGDALRPKCNNIAIQAILQQYSGNPASVVDTPISKGLFTYNGQYQHNGAEVYNQPNGGTAYGLFDVTVIYQASVVGVTQAAFQVAVTALVNGARAGGTQMRNLTINVAT